MCDALRELFAEELEECRERGLEEGRAEGLSLAKKIFKLSASGVAIDEISRQCDISVDYLKEILE